MCLRPLYIHRQIDPIRNLENNEPIGTPKDGIPILRDEGLTAWLVPCGKCVECLKRRKNDWYVRLCREFDCTTAKALVWCTFTFDEYHLPTTRQELAAAIRRFKDNIRKQLGYFPLHWFITERGESGRLHIHGFLFMKRTFIDFDLIRNAWKNGYCWLERCESKKAVSYSLKYALKGFIQRVIEDDPLCARVYCSQGIGSAYLNSSSLRFVFNESDPYGYRRMCPKSWFNGFHYAMPRYYIYRAIRQYKVRKYPSYDDWKARFDEAFNQPKTSIPIIVEHLENLYKTIVLSFKPVIREQCDNLYTYDKKSTKDRHHSG